ncbi:MAG: hypothetical protein U5K30_16715 [Acidimicrobiales bacterium]|nr:hypothetical protein [Acidimicrobiales bacterium]
MSDGTHGMVVLRFAGGHETTMSIESVTTATPEHARLFEDNALMVVADRIPERVRRIYNDEGVSWWDRRGHLRLTSGPVFIDADVPAEPRPRSSAATNPLAGVVVAGVSITALSAFPNPIPGVRELARKLDASPGGVSLAAKRLIDAGLLTMDRVAAQPGLFWAVSDQWRPDWNTIEGTPTPAEGLVAVGSLAAAELGAPLAVTRDAPIELLAADRAAYRRALRSSAGHGTTRIALAPTPAVCDVHGPEATVDGHRCARPVVVAALLATDPGRGAEIIEDWEMVDRAW